MRNKLSLLAIGTLVFIAGAVSGNSLSDLADRTASAATGDDPLPITQLHELAEIFGYIKERYVEEIPSEKLMEYALRGMVSALDPHSSYLSEADLEGFQEGLTNQEYGGVGIYVGIRNNHIEVVSPIYGTPAARANLKSGDIILKINDISTQNMEIDSAVEKMRGEIGTVLTVEVFPADGGDIRTVELVREKIVTPSVVSSLVDENYGYLHVTRFQNKTEEDVTRALNAMYEENGGALGGIIIDLRNNPGGYLNAGIALAAAFLPTGATVVTDQGRAQKEDTVFTAQPHYFDDLQNRGLLQTVPLVVLVNNGSASASEIVAGALQDHRRAVVAGTRTYGKASVQTVLPIRASDGKSALRLTMARYLTPSGRNIQSRGIEPDIVVAQRRRGDDDEDEEEGFVLRESNFEGSLDNPSEDGGAGEEDAANRRPPFISQNDHQYEQALIILKAIDISSQE